MRRNVGINFFFVVAYVEEISKIIPMIFIQIKAKRNQNVYTELPVIDSVPYINETVHEEADKISDKNVAKYKYITIFKYGKPNLCHANDETKFFSIDNTKKSGMRVVSYVLLRDIVLQHCLQYKK
ncbi:hypothetical protein, conserved [Plasmodium ovale curtisi]|uniref:Uncharacterized protein n=1 Tax=Plasmodium ovale curtisi TaxID=864141 RepID=A0A1A8WMB8_PLAOA|nr:hypothetical protein, conserved [Plasmodium ovale curtisi]SBS94054.1 hypothetical protein, conserved [Plasmodium ovale curtisi]